VKKLSSCLYRFIGGISKVFLARLKRKLYKPRSKTIPLHRLAKLWLGVSTDNRPPQTGSVPADIPEWNAPELNSFYKSYVLPYYRVLGDSRAAIDQILHILDIGGNCPSVPPGEGEPCLEKIALRDHSIRVARFAVDMVKKAHRDHELLVGKVLIASLGHNIGLTTEGSVLGGNTAKSLLVLEPFISDLPFKQDIIEAIKTYNDNNPKGELARILRAANAAARKVELNTSRIFDGTANSLDLEKIKATINAYSMEDEK